MSVDWWERWGRRRRWPFFRRFFEELDEFMREFEREVEEEFRILSERVPRELVREKTTKDGIIREIGPIVYGYSITIGPDGRPIIREFGNIRPGGLPTGRPFELKAEREPLVDVIDEEKQVRVVAEIPGVNKEDIDLSVDERSLTIKVDTEKRKYYKEVELPAPVDPQTAKANYNNGVLEVTIGKKPEAIMKGRRIKVE